MKKYKHREDEYIVETLKDPDNDCYKVYGYRCCGCSPSADWFVNIAIKDFIELFEPVEEYCCDEFKNMAQRGVFYARGNNWYMVYLDNTFECVKIIHGCPFCLRPLKEEKPKGA